MITTLKDLEMLPQEVQREVFEYADTLLAQREKQEHETLARMSVTSTEFWNNDEDEVWNDV